MWQEMYRRFVKRFIDITFTTLGSILLLPLILVVALAVRITLGTPIIFAQQRPGKHGRPFTLYKFRTMSDVRDAAGDLLPDSARMTKFGQLLRSTSLDEWPTLYNVFKGDMSLVGPRPLLMHYLDLYTVEEMRRHDVLPGITGWAQVNGRNGITWEEKFAKDIWYVENQSLLLDMRILYLTVVHVFRREGITQTDHVTTEQFQGSQTTSSDPAQRPQIAG